MWLRVHYRRRYVGRAWQLVRGRIRPKSTYMEIVDSAQTPVNLIAMLPYAFYKEPPYRRFEIDIWEG